MGNPTSSPPHPPNNLSSSSHLSTMSTPERHKHRPFHPAAIPLSALRNTAKNRLSRSQRSSFATNSSSFSKTFSGVSGVSVLCVILLVSLASSSAVAADDPPSHHNHRHRNHHHNHNHHHNDHSGKNASPDASPDASDASPSPPRVSLGISDASAVAGRLFEYSIPPHAFSGDVRSFRASEAGLDQLPKWMGFKEETGLFFGVPDESDVGQTYVSVTAIGVVENDAGSNDAAAASFAGEMGAKDVFSISVVAKAPRLTASPFALLKNGAFEKNNRECAPEEPSTIASVVVDRVFAEMVVEERIQLLEKFAQFVQLPLSSLSLFPVSQSRRVFDSAALVAGPGNVKGKRGAGVFLQWQIGCGHDFTQANIESLEKIETCSKNGTLATRLSLNVIGWHVVNHLLVEKQRRKKRRIHYNPRATATLQPGPIAPTKATPDFHGTATYNPIPPAISSSSSSSSSSPANVKPSRVDPVIPTRRQDPWERTTTTTTTTTTSPRDILRPSSTVEAKTDSTTEKLTTTATTTTTSTTTKKKTTTTLPPTTTTTTLAKINNNDNKINLGEFGCDEGKYCEHLLPEVHRMFPGLEKEDVEVTLLKGAGIGLPHNSWIKYDKIKNVIYGLPLKDHLKPRVMELVVMATDSVGNVFRDAITVKIHHRKGKKKKVNHEFLFKFEMDHDKFKNDVEARIRFLRTLAGIFSSSPSDIIITKVKGGSTVVGWTNGTLPYSPCPINDLSRLKNVVFDDQNQIKNSVIKPMAENDFILNKVSFMTHGPCEKLVQIDHAGPSAKTEDEFLMERDSDVWITTILPAVVIAIILVLAACIACILYKKSRRGKLSLSEKRTFLNKGIPVIFVDELLENPEPPHTPLILKEEKPPLPPPEYPRSSNGSAPSTPTSEHKEPLSTTEDEHEEGDFPPLHSTGSLGRRSEGKGTLGRSNGHHPAPFRAPPPYMPPS